MTWDAQYRRDLNSYQVCAKKLELLVEDLLKEANVDVVDVENRAKDPDSLARKVERKKDEYPDPLTDVTDLIGVRIITYYLEDVEKIGEVIRREFLVDDDNSVDKLDDLEPDRFGYRSVHYVVSLSKDRADLTEWGVFSGKRAEIQLRTASQHAWAAIEHKLNYKRAREAPRHLRRRLMRLSALYELADEQFSGIRSELEKVEAQYSYDLRGGNLELPIDRASLEAFVEDNDLVDGIIERAVAAGFPLDSLDVDGYREQLNIDFRDLVSILDALEVETIAQLDALLREDSSMSNAIDAIGKALTVRHGTWGSPIDVLCTLILFHTNAPKQLITSIYQQSILDLFAKARVSRNQSG